MGPGAVRVAEGAALLADHHGLHVAGHAAAGVAAVEGRRGRGLGQQGNVRLRALLGGGRLARPERVADDDLEDGAALLDLGRSRHNELAGKVERDGRPTYRVAGPALGRLGRRSGRPRLGGRGRPQGRRHGHGGGGLGGPRHGQDADVHVSGAAVGEEDLSRGVREATLGRRGSARRAWRHSGVKGLRRGRLHLKSKSERCYS